MLAQKINGGGAGSREHLHREVAGVTYSGASFVYSLYFRFKRDGSLSRKTVSILFLIIVPVY